MNERSAAIAPPTDDAPAGQAYWRSLEEHAGSPEVRASLAKEFPGYDPDELLSMGRRKFMRLAGASIALAGLTLQGCRRWPKEQVLPYNARPDGTMPGVPERFASMVERGGYARGVFVTSFDGRPIGLDGNPLDPTVGDPEAFLALQAAWLAAEKNPEAASGGAIHALNRLNAFTGKADNAAQASCLEMYDPDRSRSVIRVDRARGAGEEAEPFAGGASTFEAFLAAEPFAGRVAVLATPQSGPAAAEAKKRFEAKHGAGSWHVWEPLNRDNEIEGLALAFGGEPVRLVADAAKADVIACFDDDFLAEGPGYLSNAAGWAVNRRSSDRGLQRGVEGEAGMSRLYAAAPSPTCTLASADVTMQVTPACVLAALQELAARLGVAGVAHPAPELLPAEAEGFLAPLAGDLQAAARGRTLVTVGRAQPAAAHALAAAINAKLGNLGETVRVLELPAAEAACLPSLSSLLAKLDRGEVDTLLVLDGNPVFDAPADLGVAEAFAKAPTVVRLGLYVDETSAAADWHLPRAHALESWGDGRAWDGTLLLQQPLLEPLFGGRTPIELAAIASGDPAVSAPGSLGYHLVRRAWAPVVGASGYDPQAQVFAGELSGIEAEKAWRGFVHDGLVRDSAFASASVGSPAAAELPDAPGGDFQLVFAEGSIGDGRYANSGWLQELPEPLTKVTWDNPVRLSMADARGLGVDNGDTVTVTTATGSVDLPVYVMPGQAKGVAVVNVGQGRRVSGNVGTGVGQNVYPLRSSGQMWSAPATIASAGGHTQLATTSTHHLISPFKPEGQHGRGAIEDYAIQKRAGKKPHQSGYTVKEATLAAYLANPGFASAGAHTDIRLQLFDPPSVTGPDQPKFVQPNPDGPDTFNVPHAWGMSIDMSTCTGCNACVVACQAENNIPVVGRDQVLISREMHWIRIDTYFKGDPEGTTSETFGSVNMPLACVMCENAPCEQVCPVAATVHDTEGLNAMVYNRCIGTRYCSNNCPYKVRRFNYFDYHSKLDSSFFRSKKLGIEVQNKPWLDFADTQQGDVVDQVRRMLFNPDVTVRMRGVMEKCTYCTQRISRTKIALKADWAKRKTAGENPADEDRLVQDGEIRTACQNACPTDAIVFGNLNDPDSHVSVLQQHNPRSYALLSELNHRARTEYLAKISNPVASAKGKDTSKSHDHG
ncbi:TAT-variant-translocated molybdopterin oxidoreductase [Phycisphaera mikurensis]|uniref:Molybdenum binding protein n=1 Tax=Phycisphaera mikurensis (strain NBRC 102666 / KCTC 22515 / FYK2301M01) TaxID=1142394 RepID=I0ICC2_PHYMF|nr:TAT-variant-translocated molybdopterin oxidoreductase [Phycisphaera mikurensis]MBB6442213.1 molybdopterin-containing oxidoreductase family iron-sulfur binding subunit [Phycisphaera mikurensis]BAM02910.1 molybdenum binding protein [Phycisphaera mikurensis NBRC 102666]